MEKLMMRCVTEADREAIAAEIAKDPYHKDIEDFTPGVFLADGKSMVFGDDKGDVAYVNVRNIALVTVQFCDVGEDRVKRVITECFPGFAQGMKKAGALALIYESECPRLIAFFRMLGFRAKKYFMKELA
jgi:hypothetical protein